MRTDLRHPRSLLAATLLLALSATAAAQHAQHVPAPATDTPAATDPHAGHAQRTTADDPHAAHRAQPAAPAADPHAAHRQSAADPHAGHGHDAPASDPHAGHRTTSTPPAADPHAAHRAQSAATADDPHAGHAGHGTPAAAPHAGHRAQSADTGVDAHDHGTGHHHHGHHGHAGHAPPAASATPRTPIPPLTEADLAAAFPVLDHHAMEHASPISTMLLVERLEAWDADHGTGQAWEVAAWIGGDLDRVWLRSEGEREAGRTGKADVELLYGRGVTPWWDVVAGVRHDFQPDARSWAAFGVQGLAPYMFEVSAMAYAGSGGQVQTKLEAEYEMRFTNRLILQPAIEATASLKDEPGERIGSGLNSIEAGLRLRYEFSRRFAPYIGVVHERSFGDTADYQRAAGGHARDTRVVAGLRMWF
ncbi:copper resistance protein B [Luteimonas sp. BDR2-5]|uniref:copper resistance protein B n=1 Tax=Proluteimonas luteida TaxID=2878685 RepID=UPI001E514D46|nr:copper resistance protein B [Luteimonas sp. BDR2-5]MCD9029180.1 copper resistance protein B [Luteimonas sp. BDR2-5]